MSQSWVADPSMWCMLGGAMAGSHKHTSESYHQSWSSHMKFGSHSLVRTVPHMIQFPLHKLVRCYVSGASVFWCYDYLSSSLCKVFCKYNLQLSRRIMWLKSHVQNFVTFPKAQLWSRKTHIILTQCNFCTIMISLEYWIYINYPGNIWSDCILSRLWV